MIQDLKGPLMMIFTWVNPLQRKTCYLLIDTIRRRYLLVCVTCTNTVQRNDHFFLPNVNTVACVEINSTVAKDKAAIQHLAVVLMGQQQLVRVSRACQIIPRSSREFLRSPVAET